MGNKWGRWFRLLAIPSLLILLLSAYQNCGRVVSFSDGWMSGESIDPSGEGETSPNSSPDSEDSKAVVQCDEEILKHKDKMIDVANGASFDQVNGNLVLHALGDIGEISNVNGNVIVYSETGGYISLVNGIRGNVVLCGMSVAEIADVRGYVKTSKSDIGNLENIRGNVIISDGDVTDVDNIGGHLKIENGRILGVVGDVRGQIEVE